MRNKTSKILMWGAVLFACLLTHWPTPVSKAQPITIYAPSPESSRQDSIRIYTEQVDSGKALFQKRYTATNRVLDKIPAKRKVNRKCPANQEETVYIERDSSFYELSVTRQGGLLIVNIDSFCNANPTPDSIIIIHKVGNNTQEAKPTFWRKLKSIFKRKK